MKTLVIGANGIGSYFLRNLSEAIEKEHIKCKRTDIIVADDDKVEVKNTQYATYGRRDIGGNKAILQNLKHGYEAYPHRIKTKKQIDELKPELVILAADNSQIRHLVLKSGYPFIDMRAEGRIIMAFDMTKAGKKDKEKYLELTPEEEGSASCQRMEDLVAGTIQYGNRVVAEMGMQIIFNFIRKDPGAKFLTMMV